MSGCTSSGTISVTANSGSAQAGGIVGSVLTSTLSNCSSSVNVSASFSPLPGATSSYGSFVGGIVGQMSYGSVLNCESSGNISSASGSASLGGIVGFMTSSAGYDATVTGCHKPSGAIGSGTGKTAGGIIGINRYGGIVTNNDFSKSATGQTYGIGYDSRHGDQPSNDGTTPLS